MKITKVDILHLKTGFGIVQNFAKLIIGMNPLEHEVIWDKLYRTTFWGQNCDKVTIE